jgi:hypothetical protein
MLKPPDPITKTFFKSIGFAAFFTTPLSIYAFAVGAGCDSALRIELENRRIWYCALFSTGL